MKASEFVERLDKVRQTGNSRWTARCPAHPDKNPSLIVSEGDDGRVLIHCFAGCGIEAIVAAVGAELADIMPEVNRGQQQYRPIRKPFPAADVLECLATQSLTVLLCAAAAQRGELDAKGREELASAVALIEEARRYGNG